MLLTKMRFGWSKIACTQTYLFLMFSDRFCLADGHWKRDESWAESQRREPRNSSTSDSWWCAICWRKKNSRPNKRTLQKAERRNNAPVYGCQSHNAPVHAFQKWAGSVAEAKRTRAELLAVTGDWLYAHVSQLLFTIKTIEHKRTSFITSVRFQSYRKLIHYFWRRCHNSDGQYWLKFWYSASDVFCNCGCFRCYATGVT